MHILNEMKPIKNIVLILFVIILARESVAQQDTTLQYETTSTDSVVSYLTPMQYAFMLHEDNQWLLKTNLLITSKYRGSTNLKISLEKKLSERFSLNAVLLNYQGYYVYADPVNLYNYGLQFLLEPRWYYGNRKRQSAFSTAGNLSGAYLSLSAGYQTFNDRDGDGDLHIEQDYIPMYLKWGLQRRFLKRGYVDIGLSAGYRFSLNDALPSSFSVRTYTEAGLLFARDKHKLDFDKLCPVLRCQAADKFIFKIDLMDVVTFSYLRNTYFAAIIPNIGAEFKIGTSPFSINTMLSCKTQIGFSTKYDFETYEFHPEFLFEGRYYYNLQRRILNGKSGNGLSANYVALGAIYNGQYITIHRNGYNHHSDVSIIGGIVSTGIQRLINNNLYYDINLGFGYGRQYEATNGVTTSKNRSIFKLGIAIGYRF